LPTTVLTSPPVAGPARALRSGGYLDSRRESGRLVSGWNLVVPERVLERTWAWG